jgi:hypothetical protein
MAVLIYLAKKLFLLIDGNITQMMNHAKLEKRESWGEVPISPWQLVEQ